MNFDFKKPIPTVVPAIKEAPIAKPSVKLCIKSATKFKYAATRIFGGFDDLDLDIC